MMAVDCESSAQRQGIKHKSISSPVVNIWPILRARDGAIASMPAVGDEVKLLMSTAGKFSDPP
jgi:hypothetical protein